MRMGDQTEILIFIEQYFNDQEEMDNEIKRKQQKESEQQQLRLRQAISGTTLSSQRKKEGSAKKYNDNQISQMSHQRDIVGVVISHFKWDTERIESQIANNRKMKQGIQISPDRRSIYIQEDEYIFRNFFGDIGFNQGIHYWEIVADARTENELKIGVSSINDLTKSPVYQQMLSESQSQNQINSNDIQISFSDIETGWAFFGIGQLRHNSNSAGEKYGKSFKRLGVLGVFLNMNKGTLSFAIDGQYQGIAFEDEALKNGPLYPAVSLLHNAGCILVSGKAPPPYFYE